MTCGALSSFLPPSAIAFKRSAFAALSSGWYFMHNFKSSVAWFLSSVVLNCCNAGGILRRSFRILRWRWRRTYLGHLTNLDRSRVGRMSPPTRKFRGVAWKRGSWRFSGAGAGFFFSGSFLELFLDGMVATCVAGLVSARPRGGVLSCLASARRPRRFRVSSRAAATACGSTARSGCGGARRRRFAQLRAPAAAACSPAHRCCRGRTFSLCVAAHRLLRLPRLGAACTQASSSERPRRRKFTASLLLVTSQPSVSPISTL
ncbi:unnamed protein product [Pelagomonas calceolata]|uniref:Uncharacterized protein n=1 Tax=Pelagomonas calceolata TaxID=35677 RepID=A0A8J2S3R3_9STRA|nr:unnamed protein product [Pelagomonas calceolata]